MVVNSKKDKPYFEKDCSTLPISRDGKILLLLFVIILVGPYLPHFGPIPGRVRLDHFLLHFVGIYIFSRSVVKGKIVVSPCIMAYAALMLWFLAITIVIIFFPVTKFSSTTISTIAGFDSYVRPLVILFIVANMRVGKAELVTIVKIILVASIPLFIIGILQLVPATKSIMNEFIVTFFDNSRATGGSGREHLHKVLSGGRVMSIFWQVSTFGMFAVLCLGLLVAQFTGARIIKSKALVILLFILSIVGGVISGSKVFTGGLLILVILCVLFSRVRHYLTRPRYIVMATVAVLLFFLLIPRILPQAYSLFAVRFKPDTFIATYNAGRFTPTFITSESFALEHPSGILVPPKIVRTGAVEIFKNYPLTGLGLSAAARTTDSFLFGILIMGGVIGGFIFILFIGIVCWRLLSIARQHPDRTVASLSLAMLFLTIVFFAAAAGFHTFIQDRVGDAYWLIVGLLFTMGIRNNEQAKLCHEKIQ